MLGFSGLLWLDFRFFFGFLFLWLLFVCFGEFCLSFWFVFLEFFFVWIGFGRSDIFCFEGGDIGLVLLKLLVSSPVWTHPWLQQPLQKGIFPFDPSDSSTTKYSSLATVTQFKFSLNALVKIKSTSNTVAVSIFHIEIIFLGWKWFFLFFLCL